MKTAVSNFKQHFFCLTNETKAARSVVDEILEELDLSDRLLLGNQVSLLIAADKVAEVLAWQPEASTTLANTVPA